MTKKNGQPATEGAGSALARMARQDAVFLPAAFAAVLGTVSTVLAPPSWVSRVPMAINDIASGNRAVLQSKVVRLEQSRDALATDLSRARNAIALRDSELSQTRSRTEELQRVVASQEKQIAVQRAARQEAAASLRQQQARIDDLLREKARLETLRKSDRPSEGARADVQARLALVRGERDQNRRTVSELESSISSLRGSLDQARTQLRAVRDESAMRAAEVARLSMERDALKTSLAAQQKLTRDVEAARAEATAAAQLAAGRARLLAQQGDQIDRLKQDADRLQSALSARDVKIDGLTEKLADVQRRHDRVRLRLVQAEERLGAAAKKEIVGRAELAAREREIKAQRGDLQHLNGRLRALEAERREMQREITSYSERLVENRKKLRSALERVKVLEPEIAAGQGRETRLAGRIAESERALLTLRAEHQRNVERERHENARQAARVQKLSSALDEARGNAETARQSLAAAKGKIATMDRQVRTLKTSLGESQTIATDQKAKISRLNLHATAARDEILRLVGVLKASDEKSRRLQKMITAGFGASAGAASLAHLDEMLKFRSEFFSRLSSVIGDQENVRTVGDRFVLQAEVLFDSGSAELGEFGQVQLAKVATTLKNLAASTPPKLNWILRVDGHTDRVPIQTVRFPSNWELSAARAIAVVRFLIARGVPPDRLSANGFGEHQPLDENEHRPASRRNRRIELKLTAQ